MQIRSRNSKYNQCKIPHRSLLFTVPFDWCGPGGGHSCSCGRRWPAAPLCRLPPANHHGSTGSVPVTAPQAWIDWVPCHFGVGSADRVGVAQEPWPDYLLGCRGPRFAGLTWWWLPGHHGRAQAEEREPQPSEARNYDLKKEDLIISWLIKRFIFHGQTPFTDTFNNKKHKPRW